MRFGGLPLEALPPNLVHTFGKRWKNGGAVLPWKEGDTLRNLYPQYKDFFLEIPCGKCIACRLAYSRQWADRCYLESQQFDNNFFVTLTYDDDHLLFNYDVDDDTGEVLRRPTLIKKDAQDFIKRLRIYFKRHYNADNIRVFYCGEYGDNSARPHYHFIFFNLPLQKLHFWNKTATGDYFRDDDIEKLWIKGQSIIAECTWQSCAYVARYVVKKRKGKSNTEHHKNLDILFDNSVQVLDPFVSMSRRPALGKKTVEDDIANIEKFGSVIVNRGNGKVSSAKLPKFLKKFAEGISSVFAKFNVKHRNDFKFQEQAKLERTSLSIEEYRAIENDLNESILKKLPKNI